MKLTNINCPQFISSKILGLIGRVLDHLQVKPTAHPSLTREIQCLHITPTHPYEQFHPIKSNATSYLHNSQFLRLVHGLRSTIGFSRVWLMTAQNRDIWSLFSISIYIYKRRPVISKLAICRWGDELLNVTRSVTGHRRTRGCPSKCHVQESLGDTI